ncbi:MAG: alpha/beta fold hydrolase [Jiangellaceae bacterium]
MESRVRTVGLATDVTVPYVTQGDPSGVPVLLLHPWAESMGCFDRLLPLLLPSLRVLAWDQRGHCHADKPLRGFELSDFAADVVAFLDALDLTAAVMAGSSSGGYVAQQVAMTSPERVLGLVLIGSPRSLQGRPAFADELDRLTDPVDSAWVRESLDWFPRFHEIPDWYLEDRVADGCRLPARVWRDALTGLTRTRPPTETGTITTPTLILWGDRDELLTRADQERLAEAIPGSRLVIYEDTGHLVRWEQPDRVAADLANLALSVELTGS